MFEKIINDLMDAATDMECSQCPIRDCPNYEAPDREACLFTLAANTVGSLKKENRRLKKELSEVSSELSWTRFPERMGQ